MVYRFCDGRVFWWVRESCEWDGVRYRAGEGVGDVSGGMWWGSGENKNGST